MKRHYTKPEVHFMKLQIEERLATCGWPSGEIEHLGSPPCNSKTFVEIADIKNYCQSRYDNVSVYR